MQVTKTTVVEDKVLRQIFQEGVDHVALPADQETLNRVYLAKVYNARCNEYLRAISSEATQNDKKTTNIHVGLRDKLKVYAAEKQIPS